jgi:flagellar protein FlaJ
MFGQKLSRWGLKGAGAKRVSGDPLKALVLGGRPERREFKDIYALYAGAAVGGVLMVVGVLAFLGVIPFEFRPGEDGNSTLHTNALIDWMVLALTAMMAPYGYLATRRYRQINEIERRLPDFLRDVAEAGRFGMTLPEAIIVASRGRYGPLTDEIKKMASQLEWGVPVAQALKLFEQRINTPLTSRVVAIITKANEAGGNVADVLTMVAHDTREAQLSEEQRRIAMSTYLAVIIISFAVFLVTIYIMAATFLPQMVKAGNQLAASGAGVGAVSISIQVIPLVFLAFLVAVVVHAVGDGIMAGVIESGRIPPGLLYGTGLLLGGWAFMRFFVPILNV